jgi:hypothetical protein
MKIEIQPINKDIIIDQNTGVIGITGSFHGETSFNGKPVDLNKKPVKIVKDNATGAIGIVGSFHGETSFNGNPIDMEELDL